MTTGETARDVHVTSSAGAGFETVVAAAAARGGGGYLPVKELIELLEALQRDPEMLQRHISAFMTDAMSIAMSAVAGAPVQDDRFRDKAWQGNPVMSSVARSYLACCDTVMAILDDADLEWRTRERLRAPIENILAGLSPTNNPWTNPQAWQEFVATDGESLRRGLANLAKDLASPTRLPAGVDRSAFTLGENIAATPGKIVRRERLYELIDYLPRTDVVDEIPVLMVPSPVNKYYLLDLEPEKSIVGAHLDRGRRLFVPSWVQPDYTHADVGFDAYVEALVEALETVAEITGQDRVHLLGLCGGGQIVLMTAAYLAAIDRQDLLATLTIGIAVVDFHEAQSMVFLDEETAELAIAQAKKEGVFSAVDTARSFALMRPIEGVWNGVVNNYVLGRTPPAVALLYWAADQTNMAARFGEDMIRTGLSNGLTKPGGVTVLGQPLDTRKITVDTYVLGASTDHISPWKHCYRTLDMVGGDRTFVLANGGHAIAISRPHDHPKSCYWTGAVTGTDPDSWLAAAEQHQDSWWNHWTAWIEERTPQKVPAPEKPGSRKHPVLGDAPGEYVKAVFA
ncbi:MAG: alpha/beta fold hydrolase [Nocardioidaceae bacterium]